MMEWLAGALDAYVLGCSDTEAAPPSLKHRRPSKRKYTVVSPEAAWNLMEKAAHGANIREALALKEDEACFGCSRHPGEYWTLKKQKMYSQRISCVFSNLHHWNLVADPGNHSYKSIMAAVLYGWEQEEACFPPFQILLPGKGGVTPFDCELEDDMFQGALEMKLERVASYRQLQAYSNMIFQVTRGMLTLNDFHLPQSCCVRPVQHNEMRQSVQEGNIIVAYIRNNDTGERRVVLPQDVSRVRMLILGLDEGSVGTAGVAAAAFQQKKTVWAKFDKIHRIIRDLKLAESHCCNKILKRPSCGQHTSMGSTIDHLGVDQTTP